MKTIIKKEIKPFTIERVLESIDNAFAFATLNQLRLNGQMVDVEKYQKVVEQKLKTETSLNMRKKLNKAMNRFSFNITRKSINLFFHYLNKRLELGMPVKFEMSVQEQEVIISRENYKLLKNQLEEARKKYKDLKQSYYGKNLKSTEYMEN